MNGRRKGGAGASTLLVLAAIAGSAAPAAPAGVDVPVNVPEAQTSNNSTQFETTIAVHEGKLCAGWIDTGSPAGLAGLGESTNGGATWSDHGEITQQGDPVVAIGHASGLRYYARIADFGGAEGIAVSRAMGDCQFFNPGADAAAASSGLPATTFSDKPWIAVDNTGGLHDGNVYVCWSRFFTSGLELRFSRSVDGAASFQSEKVLAPSGNSPFGCNVQVGPGGQVYVAYMLDQAPFRGQIWIRRSLDGGLSFGPSRFVTASRHPGIDRVITCGTGTRPTLKGDIRQAPQVWLATDTTGGRYDGRVYALWVTDPLGVADNADAYLRRSTNGGASWSKPVRVGGGSGLTDQFMPMLAVGGRGQVAIAWYDRRADPNNLRPGLYGTFSLNGGRSLMPVRQISDVTFPIAPLNPNFDSIAAPCHFGEYIGVAADDSQAYYLWSDYRRTVTNAQWPSGRPDPDVYFDRLSLPPIPSNAFRIVRVIRNRARGTAAVVVRVPGPGTLRLRGKGLRKARRAPGRARKLRLPVRPRGGIRRKLDASGSARVRARVIFTPTYGEPNGKRRPIKLIER